MGKLNWLFEELGDKRNARKRCEHPPIENYVPKEARPDITDRVLEAVLPEDTQKA